MRTPPPSSNPTDIAREALRMDKDTGDKTFRIMAIGMMFVTALATAAHALHGIFRDMKGSRRDGREYDHGDRRAYPPPEEPEYRPSRHDKPDGERQWSRREEDRGRSPKDEEGWAQSHRQQGHGRER